MKEREIYWYEDLVYNRVIVGYRGGSEYTMDLNDFKKEVLRQCLDLMNPIDPKYVLKLVMRESQYIDFEIVPEEK